MIVQVKTSYGQAYIGSFRGFDPNSLSICLADAKDEKGRSQDLVFILGQFIQEIVLAEKPFDLEGLTAEISRLFPKGEVKLDKEARVILVLNKVKVTENGVEGTGPIAERVQKIYESYIEELEASRQESS
ncbi:MAG: Lsm family RNA-binding protein [Candidatus Ranarchaeia archaeon]